MENLLQCKGKKFKANIYNIPVEGRIQVEEGLLYIGWEVYHIIVDTDWITA